MLVVDIQGFNIPHFVPKEMAITDGDHTSHYLFRSPCPLTDLPLNIQNKVISTGRFDHGLKWNEGFVNLSQISAILTQATRRDHIIYCMGSEVAEYLKQHTNIEIVDASQLPELSDFTFNRVRPPCFSHTLNFAQCCLSNVCYLHTELVNTVGL